MIFLSKYQDNQLAEPVKTKSSPFRSLDRTCNLIEEAFRKKNHQKEKLNSVNPWFKKREYFFQLNKDIEYLKSENERLLKKNLNQESVE